MDLIKVKNDVTFSRDTSTGGIVNTNVIEFNAAMQRKQSREEHVSELLKRVAENESKLKELSELVEKLLGNK